MEFLQKTFIVLLVIAGAEYAAGRRKNGTCPEEPEDIPKCPPHHELHCLMDRQCEGIKKCCSNGCTLKCEFPIEYVPPIKVHGGYSDWSEFADCSKGCGGGDQSRHRTCTNPTPQHGGRNCSSLGSTVELQSCNAQPCPINGGFTEWSSYSDCSASCGGGDRRRLRTCTNPTPQHGGKDCSKLGKSVETETCNGQPCPTPPPPPPTTTTATPGRPGPRVTEEVHGGYSEWSEFTECSTTCGDGFKTRTRQCTNPTPNHGGRNCSSIGKSTDTEDCNVRPCRICLKTTEGNANGECCKFPFIYKAKTYSACTTDNSTDGRPWCATTSDYDKDTLYGLCPAVCAHEDHRDCTIYNLKKSYYCSQPWTKRYCKKMCGLCQCKGCEWADDGHCVPLVKNKDLYCESDLWTTRNCKHMCGFCSKGYKAQAKKDLNSVVC